MLLKILALVLLYEDVAAQATDSGEWGVWSACSRSCGGGVQTRHRPYRQSIQTQRVSCKAYSCHALKRWNPWSECSKQCGGGVRTRTLKDASTTNNRSISSHDFSTSCNTNPCSKPSGCGVYDVVFLLDSSGSMGFTGWWRVKQFAVDIVRSLTTSQYFTRIGLVIYSTKAEVVFHLKRYDSPRDMQAAILKAEFLSGATDTASGFQEAMTAFSVTNGDRPHIPNLLIWVTDGVTTLGMPRLKTQAEAVKKAGINIIGVPASWLAKTRDLGSIVSYPSSLNLISVNRLTELPLAVPNVTKVLCRGPPSHPYKNKDGLICCTHSGDPHTRTFDGSWIHYQGKCTYILAAASDSSFQIHVKQEHRHGNNKVSYVKYLDTYYQNITVRLDKGRVVKVNDDETSLPYNTKAISVTSVSGQLLYKVQGQFEVSFDGVHSAKVCVNERYSGSMEGLCGNADGDKFNDFITANGEMVTENGEGYTAIGDSYQVNDTQDTSCGKEAGSGTVCSDDDFLEAQGAQYCGLMEDKDGPFSQCLGRIPAQGHVKGCLYDVCSNVNNTILMKALACNALTTMAEECEAVGATVGSWSKTVECSEGVWEEWGDWSKCSATCMGTQMRHRKCMTSKCTGYAGEIRYCGPYECDRGWSDWSEWSECSKSCGLGYSERTRYCLGEPGTCDGKSYEGQNCNLGQCPATWSPWTSWSRCSRTCDYGYQYRTRTCSQSGSCAGTDEQTRGCEIKRCPPVVETGWDIWTSWSSCSASCGTGTQYRTRNCMEDACTGLGRENRDCNIMPCSTTTVMHSTTKTTHTVTSKPTTTPKPTTTSKPTTTAKPTTTPQPTTTSNPSTTPKPTTTLEPTTAAPPTAPPVRCVENYTVYLPLEDDYKDKSCRNVSVCAIGDPKLVTLTGTEKVMSFDGNSYLEVASFNMQNAGHYVENMTITVRFKVTAMPRYFAMILGNGEIDTRPTVDVHVDYRQRLVAGINYVYFAQRQVSRDWTQLTMVFNKTEMSLYINGRLQETKQTDRETVLNTQFPLRIGGGSDGDYDGYLTGYIDKVMVSEKVVVSTIS